jgi:Kdo2-lipid IVA lauroyltransferase/acyltransferase
MFKKIAPKLITILFKSLGILPLGVLQTIGVMAGWIAWILPGKYKERARANLLQAFPDATETTLRSAMLSSGQLMFEMPFWWTRRNDPFINTKLQCDDWKQFQVALEKGKGVILLSPHAGCFELLGPVYSSHFPSTVLFRPPRKRWLQDWIVEMRSRPQLDMAPANLKGVRALVKTLLRGKTVGILPDQVPPDGEGVWAPFFGRPAYTMTLVQRLQKLTGATIFVLAAKRNGIGKGYTLLYKELVEPLPDDEAAAAMAVNAEMEEMIRKMPEQYLWGYNRYKAPKVKTLNVNQVSG